MSEGRAALWTMIWVAVGFKTWGLILILMNDTARSSVEFLLLMNWPFYIPLILLGGPVIWWVRLWRVRRKRKKLLRAEWHIDEETPAKR